MPTVVEGHAGRTEGKRKLMFKCCTTRDAQLREQSPRLPAAGSTLRDPRLDRTQRVLTVPGFKISN